MKLQIITTQKTIHHTINWIELHTPVGKMVIQKKHAPMIIELAANQELAYQLQSGNKESFIVKQGIAHILRDSIKILLPLDE